MRAEINTMARGTATANMSPKAKGRIFWMSSKFMSRSRGKGLFKTKEKAARKEDWNGVGRW
jgi:hypothetical protein